MGAAFAFAGEVFGWSEQPVEGNDNEVEDNLVEDAPFGFVQVEGVPDFLDNGEVGRVGSGLRIVVVAELLVVSRE